MSGCICFRARRRAPSAAAEEEDKIHRQLSTMTTWTCLETPSAHSAEAARRRMRMLEEYILDPQRRFVDGGVSSSGVRLSHVMPAGEPLVAKGQIFLPGFFDISTVLAAINDIRERRKWDKEMVHYEPIMDVMRDDVMGESLCQVYSAYRGKFGIMGRDFVWNVYNAWESPEVAYHVSFSQTDCPRGFEPNDKFVRATTWLAGYRIARTEGGLSIEFVNQTEIGGRAVPQWIVQSVMKRTPEQLTLLTQYIHGKGLYDF